MDRYSLVRVSGPESEPITRAEAKLHLKVDDDQTADDELIDALVSAAREDAEDFTGRCFVWSTYELRLDEFPSGYAQEILLPRPPLIRVNSIVYVDAAGAEQELGSDNWQLDDKSEPARLRPAYNASWPATRAVMNAVRVSYVAGYPVTDAGSPVDTVGNVPAAAIAAIKLTLGHLYRNRESVVTQNFGIAAHELPQGAQSLLWKLRVMDFRLTA